MRRLRGSPELRRLVGQTRLGVQDLVMPYFVREGKGLREPIASMPGVERLSVDLLVAECRSLRELGVSAVLLFGIPDHKDERGSSGSDPEGVVPRAVRALKKEVPGLLVITDVCLCEYTSHGHCGLIHKGAVDNDGTLPLLAEQALAHARAGADMVAPSDMMDGRIGHLRHALDGAGFEDLPIMSYAAKYASAFYGPFREAAGSTPSFGDRRGYQMDPGNSDEALREVELDLAEGADIVMVKPGLAYLDVLRRIRERVEAPLAVYNVSGEYAMVHAAAEKGWIDGKRVMMEILVAMRRSGADIIISYHAKEAAKLLKEGWEG